MRKCTYCRIVHKIFRKDSIKSINENVINILAMQLIIEHINKMFSAFIKKIEIIKS